MTSILLLSGPNLNLLGERQPLIYGSDFLEDHVDAVRSAAGERGWTVEHLQSASEAELVAAVHAARGTHDAIIINPAAFTHYAWGLHDALACFEGPVVEVHLSNPNAREEWRHTSVVSPVATATIMGLGGRGYTLAVDAVAELLGQPRP